MEDSESFDDFAPVRVACDPSSGVSLAEGEKSKLKDAGEGGNSSLDGDSDLGGESGDGRSGFDGPGADCEGGFDTKYRRLF